VLDSGEINRQETSFVAGLSEKVACQFDVCMRLQPGSLSGGFGAFVRKSFHGILPKCWYIEVTGNHSGARAHRRWMEALAFISPNNLDHRLTLFGSIFRHCEIPSSK
jgi:hypothetical protein